jgi:hypothetical protein
MRRYWYFSSTRYAETKIFEIIKNRQKLKFIFLNFNWLKEINKYMTENYALPDYQILLRALKDVNEIWPRNMYKKNPWSWQTLKKINFRKLCGGKKQIGFDWNLFGTPETIPHPSPVLVFVDNLVRPKIASREPCLEAKICLKRSNFGRTIFLEGRAVGGERR